PDPHPVLLRQLQRGPHPVRVAGVPPAADVRGGNQRHQGRVGTGPFAQVRVQVDGGHVGSPHSSRVVGPPGFNSTAPAAAGSRTVPPPPTPSPPSRPPPATHPTAVQRPGVPTVVGRSAVSRYRVKYSHAASRCRPGETSAGVTGPHGPRA